MEDEYDLLSASFSGNKLSSYRNGKYQGSAEYKVENGKVYVYSWTEDEDGNDIEAWFPIAFGNSNSLRFVDHVVLTKWNGYSNRYYFDIEEIEGENITLNEVLTETDPFDSLSDMTSVTDTIMWCTIQSVFN